MAASVATSEQTMEVAELRKQQSNTSSKLQTQEQENKKLKAATRKLKASYHWKQVCVVALLAATFAYHFFQTSQLQAIIESTQQELKASKLSSQQNLESATDKLHSTQLKLVSALDDFGEQRELYKKFKDDVEVEMNGMSLKLTDLAGQHSYCRDHLSEKVGRVQSLMDDVRVSEKSLEDRIKAHIDTRFDAQHTMQSKILQKQRQTLDLVSDVGRDLQKVGQRKLLTDGNSDSFGASSRTFDSESVGVGEHMTLPVVSALLLLVFVMLVLLPRACGRHHPSMAPAVDSKGLGLQYTHTSQEAAPAQTSVPLFSDGDSDGDGQQTTHAPQGEAAAQNTCAAFASEAVLLQQQSPSTAQPTETGGRPAWSTAESTDLIDLNTVSAVVAQATPEQALRTAQLAEKEDMIAESREWKDTRATAQKDVLSLKAKVSVLEAEREVGTAASAGELTDLKCQLQVMAANHESAMAAAAECALQQFDQKGKVQEAELLRAKEESSSFLNELQVLKLLSQKEVTEFKEMTSALQQTVSKQEAELKLARAESAKHSNEVTSLQDQLDKMKKEIDGWVLVSS